MYMETENRENNNLPMPDGLKKHEIIDLMLREEYGYLPGEIENKFDPYIYGIYDNLERLYNPTKGKYDDDKKCNGMGFESYSKIRNRIRLDLFETGIIEIQPLGFIRGRSIDGVEVSVLIREDNGYTISLRSTGNVDVSKIALALDGGGHKMASGCKLYGSLEKTKETIINEIKKEFL